MRANWLSLVNDLVEILDELYSATLAAGVQGSGADTSNTATAPQQGPDAGDMSADAADTPSGSTSSCSSSSRSSCNSGAKGIEISSGGGDIPGYSVAVVEGLLHGEAEEFKLRVRQLQDLFEAEGDASSA